VTVVAPGMAPGSVQSSAPKRASPALIPMSDYPAGAAPYIGHGRGRCLFNRTWEERMSTLLVILLVVFLLGGGGWGYSRWRR